VVTVKPQQVEQVQRLVADHAELFRQPGLGPPSATGHKAMEALTSGDLAGAFTHGYALYRTLKRAETAGEGDRAACAVTAHVLLDTPLPDWLPPTVAVDLLGSGL
jgi:hypothetical protein